MIGQKNIGGALPFFISKDRQELDPKACQGIISPNLSLPSFRLQFSYESAVSWKLINESDQSIINLSNDLLTTETKATDCANGKPVFIVSYEGDYLDLFLPCGYYTICFDFDGITCYSEVIKVIEGVCACESVGLKIENCNNDTVDIFSDDDLIYPLVSEEITDDQGNLIGANGFAFVASTLTSPFVVCRTVVTECQTIKKKYCITWDQLDVCGTVQISEV